MKIFAVIFLVFALAISASASMIWVGVEDLALPGGDRDYNDIVLSFSGNGLTPLGTGSWQPMVLPNIDNIPFWDNSSYDGPNLNIGNFITGTGGFAGNPNSPGLGPGEVYFWGVGNNPDPAFGFFSTGEINTDVLAEISAASGINTISWFSQSNPTVLNLLFSGSDGVGSSNSFNPAGNFGLELTTSGGALYRTTSDGGQYAVFGEIPEPATYALVGLGLAGLALIRRRKIQS